MVAFLKSIFKRKQKRLPTEEEKEKQKKLDDYLKKNELNNKPNGFIWFK